MFLGYAAGALLLGDGPGPAIGSVEGADVVAWVDARGRTTTYPWDDETGLDVITFTVKEQESLAAGAPVAPPALGDTVEAAVYETPSWWEDGVDDGEVVVFLTHTPGRVGPDWTLSFALHAETARITGEFDDDWSRDRYDEVAAAAGATTSEDRIAALVEWAGGIAEQRPEAWTVDELATFHVGQAVADDVPVVRPEPFDLGVWQASPTDERHLPVGPDDPALDVLQPALDLRSVAVAVRPNPGFGRSVERVALEFVDVGVLGWIPLRPRQPTGLIGAAPVPSPAGGEDLRVRVLGRTSDGEVVVLDLFDHEGGAEQSTSVWAVTGGMARPGPWSLVIELQTTEDGPAVALRETSIHELGLLMERAGR